MRGARLARSIRNNLGQLVVEAGDGCHHASPDEGDPGCHWKQERPHEPIKSRLSRHNPGKEFH
jgi:hypothetical protein